LHAIEVFADRLRASGRVLLLCGARDQPAELISGAECMEEIGLENILPNVQAAIDRANEINANAKLRPQIKDPVPVLVS
ncbi:MAG TPA: hypothetical protein VJV22_03715, partial [Acidobacteriaceae bacterium]|nr:hypothetical protein [Acidobacteriaceae bacterium]